MKKEDRRQGFIKLHRSLLDWEWYEDRNTRDLFIHLLLTANYESKAWRGKSVRRGQRVCSLQTLAREAGLSLQEVRTALSHLKATGEVTYSASRQGTAITIKNYSKYQDATYKATDHQQTSNTRPTYEQHTTSKNIKKEKNIPPISPKGNEDVFEKYSGKDTALLDALKAFEKMRTKIKKPMTDRAKRMLLNRLDELAKMPERKIALLDTAVLHCWQSVYPPRDEQKQIEEDDSDVL